jgi:Uma2 family endonuclease
MSTATKARKPWTADELCRLPEGWRYEIDEGELVIMAPAGGEHGRIENRVAFVVSRFVYANRLGQVLTGETGFRLSRNPETLRAADVAFVSSERWSRVADHRGFLDIPPDLAIEIHDPSEPGLSRKVQQYLAVGVRSVWIIDPDARTLAQHRLSQQPTVIADKDAMVGDPVLPGFECRLRELFGEE